MNTIYLNFENVPNCCEQSEQLKCLVILVLGVLQSALHDTRRACKNYCSDSLIIALRSSSFVRYEFEMTA